GRHVGDDGVLDPSMALATGPNVEAMPAAAYDGQNYFVVWSDTRGADPDVYGARVTPDGQGLDPLGIPISTAPGAPLAPNVAFDGQNYLVVWLDKHTATATDPYFAQIYGSRVTPAGVVLDEIPIFTQPGFWQPPAIAFGGGSYLVVWSAPYANGA